jgi:hypothetical protein
MMPDTHQGLSQQELADYHRDGLVHPAYRLPNGLLQRMQLALEELLVATRGTPPERIICPHVPALNGLSESITRKWLDLCTTTEIVDLVESVLGPDVILWGSQVFCKPAGTGLEVPWHQDGEYWPIRPLATCSVWIALDHVTVENGAMRYIPGSQREKKLYPHFKQDSSELALNEVLDPRCYDESRARYDELEAGQLSLHDVFLIHGSAANRSNKRRAGFVARYLPGSSHFDRTIKADQVANCVPTKFAQRPLFLLRGTDRTNKTLLVNLS